MNELNSVQKNSAEISLDEVCYTPPFEDETHFLFCAEVPIISSEFFDAGVQDIKPAHSLLVDTESYDENIDRLKYKGNVFAIYRTYKMPTGRTQLYLTEKAGVR